MATPSLHRKDMLHAEQGVTAKSITNKRTAYTPTLIRNFCDKEGRCWCGESKNFQVLPVRHEVPTAPILHQQWAMSAQASYWSRRVIAHWSSQTNQKVYSAGYMTSFSPMKATEKMYTEEAPCISNRSCIVAPSFKVRKSRKGNQNTLSAFSIYKSAHNRLSLPSIKEEIDINGPKCPTRRRFNARLLK